MMGSVIFGACTPAWLSPVQRQLVYYQLSLETMMETDRSRVIPSQAGKHRPELVKRATEERHQG